MVADSVLFNSNYNKTSFLNNINSFLKKMPDYTVKLNLEKTVAPKCQVQFFPIQIAQIFIDSILVETHVELMVEHLSIEALQSIYMHTHNIIFDYN